jgi:hypothetical protein
MLQGLTSKFVIKSSWMTKLYLHTKIASIFSVHIKISEFLITSARTKHLILMLCILLCVGTIIQYMQ